MSYKRFTKDEVEFLKANYPNKGVQYCADKLNREYDAVKSKAHFLGLKISDRRIYHSEKERNIANKLSHKKYYENNKDKLLMTSKLLKETNKQPKTRKTKEEVKERKRKESARHYSKHRNMYKILKKAIRDNMTDADKLTQKEYNKTYRKNNWKRIYNKLKERAETDILYKFSGSLRNLIRISLEQKGVKKNGKTTQILGCSFEELRKHIEAQWEPWMNWNNKGNPKDGVLAPNKTWDIDHIVPLCTAKTTDELIALNHYSNLRPLCSYMNRITKRGNTILLPI